MTQRAEQKARTRQAILDAARSCFLTAGVDVPVDVIAEAAGVSKPTVFFHFGSRIGLQMMVAHDGFQRLLEAMRRAAGPEGTISFLAAALAANTGDDARLVWLVGDALAWSAPGTTEPAVAEIEDELRERLRADGVPEDVVGDVAALVSSGYVLTARRVALGGAADDHVERYLGGVTAVIDAMVMAPQVVRT